jgi:hypothetical protein
MMRCLPLAGMSDMRAKIVPLVYMDSHSVSVGCRETAVLPAWQQRELACAGSSTRSPALPVVEANSHD